MVKHEHTHTHTLSTRHILNPGHQKKKFIKENLVTTVVVFKQKMRRS